MSWTGYPPPPPDNSGKTAAAVIVSLVILAIIGVVSCYCAKKMRKAIVTELQAAVAPPAPAYNVVHQVWAVDAPTMEKFLQELAKEKPVRFTAQQLCSFTSNYSTTLGSGGFGVVYKGQFPNGVKIAVKVLKWNLDRTAVEQFMAEVGTIGRTYHINLVRLYGFCYDHLMSALVFEYMENGSLDKYLFSDTKAIEWEKLHEIAIGTAKGYRGTPGYSAPEFMLKNFPITHKCDVYSFGMMLFEIVGMRKNTKVGSNESLDWFPKHVWGEYEKGELEAMTLSCGIEEKDRVKAERMCMVALWCVQDAPDARPPMSAVVKMLEGGVEIMAPPKPFHYLFSVGLNVLKPPSNSGNSSDYSTSELGTNSHWYKDTTPIMAKYEIQIASSSS
ncbi:hypothetical protein F0562_018407 [Nyssa sinensis]|uniref:Protein kinase domain-containing protein n=1 Tax=Nyssa sinensis TaxID=561372 RepID=A0A5J4Z9E1_9ASTE|nr:hypothetical protein F0562_018407 [Nyssa sinensis]